MRAYPVASLKLRKEFGTKIRVDRLYHYLQPPCNNYYALTKIRISIFFNLKFFMVVHLKFLFTSRRTRSQGLPCAAW